MAPVERLRSEVIKAVAGERDERDLIAGLLRRRIRNVGTLEYRHEVFTDLEDAELRDAIAAFCGRMGQVRGHLRQLSGMRSAHQRAGWFLDAAVIYCDAVRSLAAGLRSAPVASRAVRSFRDYLTAYLESAEFAALDSDTAELKQILAGVVYQVRVKGAAHENGLPVRTGDHGTSARSFRRVDVAGWPGIYYGALACSCRRIGVTRLAAPGNYGESAPVSRKIGVFRTIGVRAPERCRVHHGELSSYGAFRCYHTENYP